MHNLCIQIISLNLSSYRQSNVNYIENSHKKTRLEDIFSSFNLRSIIAFPTRIEPNSSTIIDNIFIDEQHITDYEVLSISNGLSDHEAQLLIAQFPLPCIKRMKL